MNRTAILYSATIFDDYYVQPSNNLIFLSTTKLFKDGRPEQKLELVSVKSFDNGLNQLQYKSADHYMKPKRWTTITNRYQTEK